MSKKYPQLRDEQWLREKYWGEGLNGREIAEIVGCERTSIYGAFRRFGIPRRDAFEVHKGYMPWNKDKSKYPELNDGCWLYDKYWIEWLNIDQIAEIVGCSAASVIRAFKRHNIKPRTSGEAVKGKKRSEEAKKNYRINHADFSGKNNPNYGKCGKESSNWRGGISFEPYCPAFNEKFKEYIRDKFGRVCFLCPRTEKENGRKLSVHHVNYNKNCFCEDDIDCQFVPLCSKCHSKTNHNREYWEREITTKLHEKINGWYI